MVDRRSKPTKAGALRAARRRHKALQARRDALARLKAGESVSIRVYDDTVVCIAKGRRLVRVRPLAENEPVSGQRVLVLHNRRLRVLWFNDKDGEHVGDAYRGHAVHPPYKDIFGVVEDDP